MNQIKMALCVVDVNKAAGLVTVHSPSGSTAVLYPMHLTIALAARIAEAGRGAGAAKVGANCVFPMIFTYAEMAALKLAELRTLEDNALASTFDVDIDSEIAAERRVNCE